MRWKEGFAMVEILDRTTDQCVVVRFGGKIKGEEYKVFLEAVDERLKAQGSINMVADLTEFEFYGDLESVKEDFHFGTHEFHHMEKCAFVGDQKWIELVMKLFEPFTRATEKHFASGQLEEACDWACSD